MIRIVRIFRLFRINAYHDSFSVIGQVIYGKRSQLISSVFIILLLMIGSSLCMYSLEHEAQPEVFTNAFSGIWWATSTLLTVGYGDIYPITTLGRVFGIFIAFFGVGMVAIPTGIISAGFVDLYSSIKKRNEYGYEADMQFIKVHMERGDQWIGQPISELKLPSGVVVIGAEPFGREEKIRLQEVLLRKQNPWVGLRIKELDISRQSIIVMVKRRDRSLIPNGNMQLKVGDKLFIYTKLHLSDASEIEI